jgi:hypothetical protein
LEQNKNAWLAVLRECQRAHFDTTAAQRLQVAACSIQDKGQWVMFTIARSSSASTMAKPRLRSATK